MKQLVNAIRWDKVVGQPVTVGDVTVTPEARALVIRLPFGGFVWTQPTGVLVERGGRVERLRIVNVTRVVQIGAIALVVVITLLSGLRRPAR